MNPRDYLAGESKAAREATPVEVAKNQLDESINRVSEMVEKLTQRIDPVLRPRTALAEGVRVPGSDAPRPAPSAIVCDLEQKTAQADAIARKLSDALERIEL